jgi:hypothetical protein
VEEDLERWRLRFLVLPHEGYATISVAQVSLHSHAASNPENVIMICTAEL